MRRMSLRMNEKEHQLLQAKAKKSGISMNEFLLNYINKGDENEALIQAILANQNRTTDTILAQLLTQKPSTTAMNNAQDKSLSSTEFREFNRQFLSLISIFFGKNGLDNLQQKTNVLQDSVAQGGCNKLK